MLRQFLVNYLLNSFGQYVEERIKIIMRGSHNLYYKGIP